MAYALISFVLSGAVLLAVGELSFRRLIGAGDGDGAPKSIRFHEERGWALNPGRYESFSLGAFRRFEVSISSLGFRNDEIALGVEPARTRISVLGDSFVYAKVLKKEDRFTEKLERTLGPRYQVVNMGVPGYGTGQELLLLRELRAGGYEPGRYLVLAFFTNDPLDNVGLDSRNFERNPAQPVFSVSGTGELVHSAPHDPRLGPPGRERRRPVLDRSVFYQFVRGRAVDFLRQRPWLIGLLKKIGVRLSPPRVPGIIAAWHSAGWEERWAVTEDVLRVLVRDVGAMGGVRLLILFIPSPFQVEETARRVAEKEAAADASYGEFVNDMDRPQRLLGEFCRRAGVPFVDATPALRAASGPLPLYFLAEGHLTERGSVQVAEVVSRAIVDEEAR